MQARLPAGAPTLPRGREPGRARAPTWKRGHMHLWHWAPPTPGSHPGRDKSGMSPDKVSGYHMIFFFFNIRPKVTGENDQASPRRRKDRTSRSVWMPLPGSGLPCPLGSMGLRLMGKNHKILSATPEMPVFPPWEPRVFPKDLSLPSCGGEPWSREEPTDRVEGEGAGEREAPQGTKRKDLGLRGATSPCGLDGGAPSVNRGLSRQGPTEAQNPKPNVLGVQKASA